MNKTVITTICVLATLSVVTPAVADRDSHHDHRDYGRYHGYRDRPYGHERHYDHYREHERRYDYRGHWRSWDAWDDYARHHPYVREHGHYYRDHGHLMFRFCDPQGGGCFFFSIGR